MKALPSLEIFNPRMLASSYITLYDQGGLSWTDEERVQYELFGEGGVVDRDLKDEKISFIRYMGIALITTTGVTLDCGIPEDMFEGVFYTRVKQRAQFKRPLSELRISPYDVEFLKKFSEAALEAANQSEKYFRRKEEFKSFQDSARENMESCEVLNGLLEYRAYVKLHDKFNRLLHTDWITFTGVKGIISDSQGLGRIPIRIIGKNRDGSYIIV